MKFVELLRLLPETQEIHLIYGDLGILGTEDSMGCLLNDEACDAKVVNIEAKDNKLKVWVEVDE